jgi:hypothetical protein
MEGFKLNIPKPCNEDWSKMGQQANGRFCGSCAKTVVDFTGMKAAEIRDYFVAHKNERVCGRFIDSQLDSLIIQIPENYLFSQSNFHKIFLLALLLSMGTTLFSCSDKDGNKQKIEKVEVIKDAPETTTLGLAIPDKSSIPPLPKPKCDKSAIKSGEVEVISGPLMGDVIVEPLMPKIKVYKDSITMSGGQ